MDRIEAAVVAVCHEICSQMSEVTDWLERTEREVYREVVASILGSQVSFEMALAATDAIEAEGLLNYTGDRKGYAKRVTQVLCQSLCRPEWERNRRYRFPKARGEAIASTAETFYKNSGSIKDFLECYHDPFSARRYIVGQAKGIGPKQASMVLRNIGYSDDLAILDTHLLRFMDLFGLREASSSSVSTLRSYEKAEKDFLAYSFKAGWPAGILDQAVWVVMRVYQREAQWAS
jgi:N-glycosylase/DNA lyase